MTWSISLIISLILPLLFIFSPSSLQTTRTTYFLLICIVCLSNVFCLYFHIYMISGSGEPKLSYHACRFIVYISTFAKPIGIYLTFLFSIERLFSKILSKLILRINTHQQLFKKLFKIFLAFGIILILSFRLYQILKLIPRNQSIQSQPSDTDTDFHAAISDFTKNSTDRNVTFQYCFKSMNIDTYAQILSFYVIQYWYEYTALVIISLIFIILIVQQYRSSTTFSINTKFYLCLTLCLIISEFVLLFFHFIVDDANNNYTDTQLTALQFMLFAFHFRCIFLPFIICITLCYPLKQFIYEFFVLQPYTENINEIDDDGNDVRSEPYTNPHRTKNSFQQKVRQKFTRNNHGKDELQNDFNDPE